MRAAFPEYWIWALGIPFVLVVLYFVYQRVSRITTIWFSPDQYARSFPQIKMYLRAAGMVMLFFALLGPYLPLNRTREEQNTREIYLLLDVSASMNCEDIKPSRLEVARRELSQLATQLEGNKVGLILFTDNAYVQCPLTRDVSAIRLFLDLADSEQFTQTGTQFRTALVLAMDRLSSIDRSSAATTRAVVLVSDGEDHGDAYTSLLERFKAAGIRVFTVGVGSQEGAPVPEWKNGQMNGYKKYEDGSTVFSRLSEQSLKSIAEESGSSYLRLGEEEGRLASELEKEIRSLRVEGLAENEDKVSRNLYQVFLFLGIVLLFASLFIMPIRKI